VWLSAKLEPAPQRHEGKEKKRRRVRRRKSF